MIKLIATAKSLSQAIALFNQGIDEVIIGEETFGLRLPGYLTLEEMEALVIEANKQNKQVTVATNAILHNNKIEQVRPFLRKLQSIGVNKLSVGDTGLIQILKEKEFQIPYIYDGATLVTSAGTINFWNKYGAVDALISREVPFVELQEIVKDVQIPITYQVYGAYCIHQSKRMLLDNYFNYLEKDQDTLSGNDLFLADPLHRDSHYTIYSDSHGTHIFANSDLNLIEYLDHLHEANINHWYLDGVYAPEDNFIEMAGVFNEAREHVLSGTLGEFMKQTLNERVHEIQPENREMDTGFFLYEADRVQ